MPALGVTGCSGDMPGASLLRLLPLAWPPGCCTAMRPGIKSKDTSPSSANRPPAPPSGPHMSVAPRSSDRFSCWPEGSCASELSSCWGPGMWRCCIACHSDCACGGLGSGEVWGRGLMHRCAEGQVVAGVLWLKAQRRPENGWWLPLGAGTWMHGGIVAV
jgi:hypothetical protein